MCYLVVDFVLQGGFTGYTLECCVTLWNRPLLQKKAVQIGLNCVVLL